MKHMLAAFILLTTAPSLRAQPKPAADPAALLACLLSGWPRAEECHAQLIAAGPKTIAAVRPGLEQALKDDPGLPVRDHNNAAAITATPANRQPANPLTPQPGQHFAPRPGGVAAAGPCPAGEPHAPVREGRHHHLVQRPRDRRAGSGLVA